MKHEQRQPKAEGRVAGREKAAQVISHEVPDKSVGEDGFEFGAHFDAERVPPHVVRKQHPAPVDIASDAERARLVEREVFQGARYAVDEEKSDVDAGLVIYLLQVSVKVRQLT